MQSVTFLQKATLASQLKSQKSFNPSPQRQVDLNEFEASLTYKMSSRTARRWRTSVLQKSWSRHEAAKMITDFTSLS